MQHQTPRITVTDASGYTWVNCTTDISSTMFYAIDHAGNTIYVTIEHPPMPLPWWVRLIMWDWRKG